MVPTDLVQLRHPTSGLPLLRPGGKRIRAYGPAYLRLTGRTLESAADGSSYVAHSMLVDQARIATSTARPSDLFAISSP